MDKCNQRHNNGLQGTLRGAQRSGALALEYNLEPTKHKIHCVNRTEKRTDLSVLVFSPSICYGVFTYFMNSVELFRDRKKIAQIKNLLRGRLCWAR